MVFAVTACTLGILACASAPTMESGPPVPVYSEEDVPCEYEVVRRVRVRAPTAASSEADYLRMLRLAYGRAGAEVGASAVIAEIAEPRAQARRREIGRGSATPLDSGPPAGLAIRYLDPACGGG